MNRRTVFAEAVFWAAFLLLTGQGAFAAAPFSAVVRQCSDGDTLVLDTGQRVRLAGIDTPEKASSEAPEQYFFREARAFTQKQVQGVRVRVEPLSGAAQDRHSRLVAEVRLPDGSSLNEALLRKGMGFVYDHKDVPRAVIARLQAAQREALAKRAGCWQKVLSEARGPYIGNRNSKRFFTPACLKNTVSVRNRVSFPNLKAAFDAGYSPARPCGIWPAAQGFPPRP